MTVTCDLWPWKSIGFQILLRTKYVPSMVKIHWRMLILECSQGCYAVKKIDLVTLTFDLWPWKSIGFQIFLRTKYVQCTKFGQNPLKDVDSRVLTRVLCCKNKIDQVTLTFDLWPWKSIGFQIFLRTKYVQCTKFGENPLKDVDSSVQKDVTG